MGEPEPADHALGRSRGGWTTKLHLACEQGQKPLSLVVTAGQRGDSPQFQVVLGRVRVARSGSGKTAIYDLLQLSELIAALTAVRNELYRRET